MSSSTSNLNPEQQQAVEHFEGACLVTAVPGSGKTSTLIHRILRLIERGIEPKEILAVTFTNKAAKEMRDRLVAIDPTARAVWISTFHKLCGRILRRHGSLVGLKDGFTIYDEDDQLAVIGKVHRMLAAQTGEEAKIHREEKYILANRINDLRESAKPFDYDGEDPRLLMYIKELEGANAIDFSGMLYLAWRILSKDKKVRDTLSDRFKFVLVDEAQDTNDVQYALAKLIASHGNLFMVGDFQQCVHEDEKLAVPDMEEVSAKELPSKGLIRSYRNGKITEQKYRTTSSLENKGVRITLESGASLSVSLRHRVYATGLFRGESFLVYLMYRPDLGFRVGSTNGRHRYGNRAQHEHATKLWVLEEHDDLESALLAEQSVSLKFGVPSSVFNGTGRGINQDRLNSIFEAFGQNGFKVLESYNLDFALPLWQAKSFTTARYSRRQVYLCAHGPKGSQVYAEWPLSKYCEPVRRLGVTVTKAKPTKNFKERWKCRKFFTRYPEAVAFAEQLAKALDASISERITVEGQHLFLTTASAVRRGCCLPVEADVGLSLEKVTRIEPISGNFISVGVEDSEVFFNASGILSHNSIFSWRGAKPENLNTFLRDFPQAANIVLPRNYRSRSEILEHAENLIVRNPNAYNVRLVNTRGTGGTVTFGHYETDRHEAWDVVAQIQAHNQGGIKWGDMAIIYRVNRMSHLFELGLAQANIPFHTVGGPSFYNRKEIKTTLAYLKLLENPSDSEAFHRAISNPKRGVGDALVGQIDTLAKEESVPVLEAAAKIKARTVVAQTALEEFLMLIDRMKTKLQGGDSLSNVADGLTKESGYLAQLQREAQEEKDGPKSWQRLDNLEELLGSLDAFEAGVKNPSLAKYLQQVALVQEGENPKNRNSVSLLTMHAAKGLEFPVVFVVGCVADIIPHVKSIAERREDEERRLFYVALTRAKDYLHVSSYESKRYSKGGVKFFDPSYYIQEAMEKPE